MGTTRAAGAPRRVFRIGASPRLVVVGAHSEDDID